MAIPPLLIRPKDLPAAPSVNTDAAIPVDNGTAVQRATATQIVNSGRPFASQPEAEAGVSATTAMSPLTTKQAIEAQVPPVVQPYVDLAEAWAESPTNPDPMVPTSKSSKTWAGEAAASAAYAAMFDGPRVDQFSDLVSIPTSAWQVGKYAQVRSLNAWYRAADSASTDYHVELSDGRKAYVSPDEDGIWSVEDLGLSDGADATARISRLISDAGIRSMRVPQGSTLKLDAPLNAGELDFRIGGYGTLDLSGGGNLTFSGSQVALPSLSTDIAKDARTITFSAPHGLSVGDHIVVWSNIPRSAGLSRDYYNKGFRALVGSIVSPTEITMQGRGARWMMEAATSFASLVTGGAVDFFGFLKVIPNNGTDPLVLCDRRNGVRLDRALDIPPGAGRAAIGIRQCIDFIVRDPKSAVTVTQDSYPVVITNSAYGVVDNVISCFSTRHALAHGSGQGNGAVPCHDITINSCMFRALQNAGAADMHGSVFYSVFNDCLFDPGISLGGGWNSVHGGRVYAFDSNIGVNMSELYGGTITFDGVTFYTNGANGSTGVINVVPVFLTEGVTVEALNCRHIHNGLSSDIVRFMCLAAPRAGGWDASTGVYPSSVGATQGMRYEVTVAGAVGPVSFNVGDYIVWSDYGNEFVKALRVPVAAVVRGITSVGMATMRLVFIGNTMDVSNDYTISIDNVDGPPGAFVAVSSAVNAACKMRLPRQTVSVAMATTTSINNILSGTLTYKWAYPRRPNGSAAFYQNLDGVLNYTTLGATQALLSDHRTVSTRVLLRRIDGSNWGLAANMIVTADAWINDL